MITKIALEFNPANVSRPIIYDLIKIYDLKCNILRADIDYNLRGHLIMEVEGDSEVLSKSLKYLEEQGVTVDFVKNKIHVDYDKCVHCGACTASCRIKALYMEEHELKFNEAKCVSCDFCLMACPLKAIEKR